MSWLSVVAQCRRDALGCSDTSYHNPYLSGFAFNPMLKHGTAYVDTGHDAYEQRYRDRVVRNLTQRAKALGLELVPATITPVT
ncbi:hypothetical protein [Herpetosiphon giganteus]|uniref:hypothetical protein n=1 Tax=Herpetosiphon giganteus TaxID=2029754 RepID=UPI00195D452A|nr:hypothetical protein [Herpetosiphon giganteus]MBM7845952.1 hypothetical protein [Herpetosiphon giganteus]